jgi:hypothetical protein
MRRDRLGDGRSEVQKLSWDPAPVPFGKLAAVEATDPGPANHRGLR